MTTVRTRTVAPWAQAVLAAWAAVVRGDDVVVDDQAAPRQAAPFQAMVMPAVDLGELFDAQAFGDQPPMAVMEEDPGTVGRRPAATADDLVRRLEPVRCRLEARIAIVDRVVGLSAAQRKKLEIAAQSDLRRLTDTVAEARSKHAGRTLKMDSRNGGLDAAAQKQVQEAHEDGQRCRQLAEAASGPESLLAKLVMSTLDEPQARKYTTVMQGRAACRWRAIVAAGLAQIDDQAGFTQKQHDAVAAILLADLPPAEDDRAGPAATMPVGMRVAQRLVTVGDAQLATILDPRQRQVVAVFAEQARAMGDGAVVFGAGMGGAGLGGGVF